MAKIYKKPETEIIEIELQQMIALSVTDATTGVKIDSGSETGGMGAKGFDFFAAPEVEEETPNTQKNQEEEWDDFEEEEI
jgi:hypothetical protein